MGYDKKTRGSSGAPGSEDPPSSQAGGSAGRVAPRLLVVCVDGTWCADSTSTTTNVEIVAKSFAGARFKRGEPGAASADPLFNVIIEPGDDRNKPGRKHLEYLNNATSTRVAYFPGIGLGGQKGEYLLNGAMALDIMDHSVDAYKFIVDNFGRDTRILMFGLSRGAFIIRCVAGMIHNCGILDKAKLRANNQRLAQVADESDEAKRIIRGICRDVYRMYRSPDEHYHPESPVMWTYRHTFSYNTEVPPVLYMGLFDTVAAVGVPNVNDGVQAGYGVTLHDEVVSEQVQIVCQALAAGDRFANFTPTFVRRRTKRPPSAQEAAMMATGNVTTNTRGVTRYSQLRQSSAEPGDPDAPFKAHEIWFPGSHYDIGRQRFIFLRNDKDHRIESLVHWAMKKMRLGINYTPALSNPPCVWLLSMAREAVQTYCGFDPLADAVITCIRKYQDDKWDPNLLDWLAGGITLLTPSIIRELPLVRLLWWPRPLSIDAYDAGWEEAYKSLSVLPVTGYGASIFGLVFNFQDGSPYVTSMTFHKERRDPPLPSADAIDAFKRFMLQGHETEYRAQTLDSFIRRGGMPEFTEIEKVPLTGDGQTEPLPRPPPNGWLAGLLQRLL